MEFGAVSAPPPQIEARVMRLFFCIATALLSLLATPSFAVKAPAYVVIDVEAGTVLAHNEAATLWPPASVTKLMTAYVTFRALKSGQLDLDSAVVVSANALKEPPSKMGYKVGTAMTLDNALKMMIVRSANDITVAIAETVGGSEQKFIERMNSEAGRLGMASTRYHNPNGLPDERQVTTARDMAVLARALWLEFPEYREYFKIPAIKVGRKVLRSHNKLLEHFNGANGMKTGFICASGFNIVASATRSGVETNRGELQIDRVERDALDRREHFELDRDVAAERERGSVGLDRHVVVHRARQPRQLCWRRRTLGRRYGAGGACRAQQGDRQS
jgi:D-alanyl-D-alanine carboxypeptidase